MNQSGFDLGKAHERFSTLCFNAAWDLMDKKERTPVEDEEMLRLSVASTWHWTQRPDCAPTNLSAGYWQTSRIHALLERASEARRYALLALDAAGGAGGDPFFAAYAYEAIARAEMIAGRAHEMVEALAQAKRIGEQIEDSDSQAMLLDDLATITPS